MLSIFSCTLLAIWMLSLEKCLFRPSTHFLIGCLFFFWPRTAWAVCIFWKLIACLLLRLQIFSPILRVACLFVLFMVSFDVQNLLSLIRSHLLIFVFFFFPITLGSGSKKILLQFMSKSVLPVFLLQFYSIQPYI